MMTETRGTCLRESEFNGPDVMGIRSGLAIFGAGRGVRRVCRQARTPRDEGPQISAIGFERGRLIVDDARKASARVPDATLLDQDAGHVFHDLHPLAAEFPDETAGRGAVAFVDQLTKQ